MSQFLNSRYQSLEAYTPGEQPKDNVYIKLNTNESPFPAGPKTVEAVCNASQAENLRLYSDPDSMKLKKAIAFRYGVRTRNVFVSNGSDDILNFSFMAFGEDGVVFPRVSYGFYPVFAELHHLDYERIPLKEDWSVDPGDYCGKGKMIVLANPNAPTGKQISLSDIEMLCRQDPDHVVLIDEAYVDFGGTSAVELTRDLENLLVVQTFSKSRSLAGARLGYAIASEGIISDLERIKYSTNPYNVNSISAAAGIAAIEEDDYYAANAKKIMETRAAVTQELTSMGFEIVPSLANFIFVRSDQIGGEELYKKLKERRILIRHFSDPSIADYNRITIGTWQEMDALMAAIWDILNEDAVEDFGF